MLFTGISKTFSTEQEQQYAANGAFWDELATIYGREQLQGLGYHWTAKSIEYVIGLKQGEIPGANCTVTLPDQHWQYATGRTEQLGMLYARIYQKGALLYEIETFDDSGNCCIAYYR